VWFSTVPLAPSEWPWILGAGFLVFTLVEVEKAVVRKWSANRGGS